MIKNTFLLLLLLPFCFSASLAQAHSLWLNIDDDQPEVGQKVRIEIGWGHKFPKDEVIKERYLNEVYALDSKGTRIPLKQVSPTEFEFVPASTRLLCDPGKYPSRLSEQDDRGVQTSAQKGPGERGFLLPLRHKGQGSHKCGRQGKDA